MFWAGVARGQVELKSDSSTLTGKIMCGYQGWFAVPSDAIGRGWYHYQKSGVFQPGSCSIDLWPDVSDLDPDERYATSFTKADGSVAYVYSAQNLKTVKRHFKWMHDYGIDGVFIQRFVTETRDSKGLQQFNNVLANCRAGASQYGRTFAVMYDLSGLKLGQTSSLIADWKMLIDSKQVTKDSMYQRHNGKPVVAVWGMGFNDGRQYTLAECENVVNFLQNDPIYGGCTVMVGLPTHWRTLDQDAVSDSALIRIAKKADIISPWFVGRYNSYDGIYFHTQTVVIPDLEWCAQNNKEYLPVTFPGFSWHNMKPASPLNQIPRAQGGFLWKQYYEFMNAGSTMVYQAMFDEIDEGTAIFKCTNDPPVGASTFVTYEGLPADHYLWLVGQGRKMLRSEIALTETIPQRPATGVDGRESESPKEYKLNQNFPNPFNPSTRIGFSVPSDSFVELAVFNMIGERVAMLVDGLQRAGYHETSWNGTDDSGISMPSGVYLCRLTSAGLLAAQKMILVR